MVGLFLASCHDAPRENPFDPQLTPAVELSVALDDANGAVTLAWTPYAGKAEFAAYRVLRNQVERTRVDTLAEIGRVDQTAYLDSSLVPNTAYEYRVSVINAGGLEAESTIHSTPGYEVRPVELLDVITDDTAGQVALTWTRYSGPRFQGYRVERRNTVEEGFSVLAHVTDRTDTLLTDGELEPDLSYIYRVVLEAAGRDWPSNRSGREGFSLDGVELLAAEGNGIEGNIQLRWTAYAGPDFQAYRVLRREVGAEEGVAFEEVVAVSDTIFVDEESRAGVDYVYTVMVRAADRELASNRLEGRLALPGVEISSVDFDSRTATAGLAWNQYQGPRFQKYRILRRTAERVPQIVAEIEESATTAFADSNLTGDTRYFYQIQVLTERDEVVESEEASGLFHELIDVWPLDVEPGDQVRLYAEPDGRIALLSTSRDQVSLSLYDSGGQLLEEQIFIEQANSRLVRPSTSTLLLPDGTRLVSASLTDSTVALLTYSVDGTPILHEKPLFVDEFVAPLTAAESKVFGEIALVTGDEGGRGQFDNATVWSGGEQVYTENFDAGRPVDWRFAFSGVGGGATAGAFPVPTFIRRGAGRSFLCAGCGERPSAGLRRGSQLSDPVGGAGECGGCFRFHQPGRDRAVCRQHLCG